MGRVQTGETTADSDDQTIVDDAYDAIYDEMRARHLVDWGPTDDIPNWAWLHIRDIVVSRTSNDFGIPRQLAEEELAISRLAKHLSVDLTGEPVEANYF